MHKRGIVLMICCMVLVSCTAAFAQQKGQKGITLGLPGSVGFVWHVSDSFAIRPEASVSFMSGHSNPTEVNEFLVDPVSASSSGSAWGLGASALFYVHRKDAVSLYLSPRFTYSRTSTTSESSSAGLTRTTEITTSVYPEVPRSVCSTRSVPGSACLVSWGSSTAISATPLRIPASPWPPVKPLRRREPGERGPVSERRSTSREIHIRLGVARPRKRKRSARRVQLRRSETLTRDADRGEAVAPSYYCDSR